MIVVTSLVRDVFCSDDSRRCIVDVDTVVHFAGVYIQCSVMRRRCIVIWSEIILLKKLLS